MSSVSSATTKEKKKAVPLHLWGRAAHAPSIPEYSCWCFSKQDRWSGDSLCGLISTAVKKHSTCLPCIIYKELNQHQQCHMSLSGNDSSSLVALLRILIPIYLNPSLSLKCNLNPSTIPAESPPLPGLLWFFLALGKENYFHLGVPPLITLEGLKSKHAKLTNTPFSLRAFIESQAPWKLLLPVGLLTVLHPEGRHKLLLNVL